MNCRETQEQLAEYSAGFMGAEQREELQAHLSGCGKCRERLGQLRELDRLLAGETLAADEELVQRIMAQVREGEMLRKWRRRCLVEGLAPIAAVLSLGMAAMLLVLRHSPEWSATVSGWGLNWEALAEPQWAVGVTLAAGLGLPLVVGAVAWLTSRVAEALT